MKNKHIGSTFDSFLDEHGIREEVEILALKKTIALQLQKSMDEAKISKSRLATEMATSRDLIDRLLDPSDIGVTLKTLTKATAVLGLKVDLRLRPAARRKKHGRRAA